MFGWLPSATCSLSKDTSFPISHIVILNLTIFLVHVPSRFFLFLFSLFFERGEWKGGEKEKRKEKEFDFLLKKKLTFSFFSPPPSFPFPQKIAPSYGIQFFVHF